MKRTILALALVATTFGAFAKTPAVTQTPAQKPAVHKSKHTKAEVKKAEPVTTPKPADKKKSGK